MEVHQQIGPYEVIREIGRGGMGVVYLAREPEEGTLIALKVLPESCTADPDRLERFRREAATVMKVRHPNIVPIYSVGHADGTWFIAMKFIQGTPLDTLIYDRGRTRGSYVDDPTVVVSRPTAEEAGFEEIAVETELEKARLGPPISWIGESAFSISSVPDALGDPSGADEIATRSTEPGWIHRGVLIVEKVARALDYVHGHGIVHRDVKPGNIIIDECGEPWLVDFGLVRDLLARRGPRTEAIMGTFQYMAPEQASRHRDKADGRCDVYALGVTLYEIATLQRPFDGDDTVAILRAARKAPIPPRELNPRLTKSFERVILKAMARNPEARYQSGAELAHDLERLRTLGADAPDVGTSRLPIVGAFGTRSTQLVVAVVAMLFMVLGLAGYCIEGALEERRRIQDCREEADQLFDRGEYAAAAEGYRMYLSLGGGDVTTVLPRLKVCDDATPPPQPPPK
jgi:serine/threonine protein kinase